ncbi:Mur ligase family protein [Candidatus Marinamargulisbacteria bacterium]|jgi:UDP-N-acetylmuramoyl-L-alanyl-D-glutamate--2,6-diaminopimelate ligase|nr:Mur ligase family protein [Candidatus Marinamargulisbacteria bacterium]
MPEKNKKNIVDYLSEVADQFKKLGLNLKTTKHDLDQLALKACHHRNAEGRYAYSEYGNPLLYYVFEPHEDSPSLKSVLLLGGIHPDEIAPLYTLWKLLIQFLRGKSSSEIKNRIIVIPLLNPDCFLGTGEEHFMPTRIKKNGVDLNRCFYSPSIKTCRPDFQAEPEIEFLVGLIATHDPSHFVITHSPLNLLELDGLCTKADREWVNRVHQDTEKHGGVGIPIKKFETYATKEYLGWSFGHLMKFMQKTSLRFEFPGIKTAYSTAEDLDMYYRKSIESALDIEGLSLESCKKESELIKTMNPTELANYAHNHYGNPSKELCVIGVTGTNGKTTVTYLIGEVLKAAGNNPFVLGTLNSGNKDLSTPQSIETLRLMRLHLDKGGTHFIMEVTSEGIDQLRVLGIDFNIKLLTNITQDHLDYHKTFENYQKTKLSFMHEGDGYKIYPESFKKEPIYFSTLLLGEYNLLNIKAAACALRHMNVPEKIIETTLSSCKAPSGRLERVEKGQLYMVLVDYAHTPDALKNVLSTLKKIADKRKGRLLVLFGCGGDRDRGKRPKMGKIACEIADLMVITDDNPRGEDNQGIMRNILDGVNPDFREYKLIHKRKEAIAFIIDKAKDNDVVVIAGKGHEDYQILKSRTIHFDDREEAGKAILIRLKKETPDGNILIE